jgi:hypothetical protein
MIKLLCSTSNIHTLTIRHVRFDGIDLVSMQQTETFQSVSTDNKIKNLSIGSRHSLRK